MWKEVRKEEKKKRRKEEGGGGGSTCCGLRFLRDAFDIRAAITGAAPALRLALSRR